MLLSSIAHSVLGWRGLSQELAKAQVRPDLIGGLEMGWQFAGAAMVVFGVLALWVFVPRWKGDTRSTFPAFVIGAMYVLFWLWTLSRSGFVAFFLAVFLVPGLLLIIGSTARAGGADDRGAS